MKPAAKPAKTIHESILKTWVDDNVSVEEKFEKRVGKRRMGTAIFIGYDYPHIDMSQQGMQERFRWAYEGAGRPDGRGRTPSAAVRRRCSVLPAIRYAYSS